MPYASLVLASRLASEVVFFRWLVALSTNGQNDKFQMHLMVDLRGHAFGSIPLQLLLPLLRLSEITLPFFEPQVAVACVFSSRPNATPLSALYILYGFTTSKAYFSTPWSEQEKEQRS
ncbi:hypothetical protein ABVK25_004783 [Lepraria finkii]|uniref:Uncharacterized protein n=1 Tax=Lepraria finkii TaxID=1340010 RepID=A0ABR4BDM4_9LECA